VVPQKEQHKSAGAKAAPEILMKLTAVIDFTNILRTAFALILYCRKITKPNTLKIEKLR